MKKEISRCELNKIVEDWLQATSEYDIEPVKEESLKCMVVMLIDYKTLLRCDIMLALMLKSIHIVQQEEDLPMLELIALEGG